MRTNPNIIGRMCIVRDLTEKAKVFVEAIVIDKQTERKAKRVRIQTGEHFGEVRMPSEYELMEFVTPGEAPACLASVWAE